MVDGQLAYLAGGPNVGTVPLKDLLKGYGYERPGFGVDDPVKNSNKHIKDIVFQTADLNLHTLRFNMDLGAHLFEWKVTDAAGNFDENILNNGDGGGRGGQISFFFSETSTPAGRSADVAGKTAAHNPNQAGSIRSDPVLSSPVAGGPLKNRLHGSPVGYFDHSQRGTEQVVCVGTVPLDWTNLLSDGAAASDKAGDRNTPFLWPDIIETLEILHPFQSRANIFRFQSGLILLEDQDVDGPVAAVAPNIQFTFQLRHIFQDFYLYDANLGIATKLADLAFVPQGSSPPPSPPSTLDDDAIDTGYSLTMSGVQDVGLGINGPSIAPSHGKTGLIILTGDVTSTRQGANVLDQDLCVGIYADLLATPNSSYTAGSRSLQWGRLSPPRSPQVPLGGEDDFDIQLVGVVSQLNEQLLLAGSYIETYYVIVGTFATVKAEMNFLFNNGF